jgi:LPS export ABC transporter protein LptC
MLSDKKVIITLCLFISKKTGRKALSFLTFNTILFASICLFFACKTNEQDLSKMAPYQGPMMEADNIERFYSDRAIIRFRMTAPREEQMESGDAFYPKGIYVEFFDEAQVRNSTLRANQATFNKAKNLWTATGNVVIIDSVKAQTMNTEELYWDQIKQTIFTDKFVTIQTKKEVLKGQGLEAKQDFSSWRILQPKGVIPINQQ